MVSPRSLVAFATGLAAALAVAAQPPLPERLADTGLNRLPALRVAPQYPLWSDGASKRRWLHLPAGRFIDARQPDAWRFPPGTKLWKEFAVDGRPVETRYIERLADGRWRFASYVWDADGREARLAPERGLVLPVAGAPDGRYAVPSRGDCLACHESAAVPVLGVSALQLSPDRDPGAPHAAPAEADLRTLVERGWLRGLPPALLERPPRIAAGSAEERAALGYLHGNCGHCHNGDGTAAPVRLQLAQSVTDPAGSARRVRAATIDAPSRYRPRGAAPDGRLVRPGRPEESVLLLRMRAREPREQMPPLGSATPDADGLAAVTSWINHPLLERKDPQP